MFTLYPFRLIVTLALIPRCSLQYCDCDEYTQKVDDTGRLWSQSNVALSMRKLLVSSCFPMSKLSRLVRLTRRQFRHARCVPRTLHPDDSPACLGFLEPQTHSRAYFPGCTPTRHAYSSP